MENLSNEQIIDIINFYKMCGISEDMYLSSAGVLDLFALLGINPEFDEQGNRVPTAYEYLGIPPKFENEKEVPIVFAIKHHVSKIHKSDDKITGTFTYVGEKEMQGDRMILDKFKQDYFSAIASGNLMEAAKLYDIIDQVTGGKADDYIGVNYNCVKFYKRMQQQLIMDIFANFVILRVLNRQAAMQEGVVKLDKLYKEFVATELKNFKFSFLGRKRFRLPKISKMVVNVSEGETNKKVVASAQSKMRRHELQKMQSDATEQMKEAEQEKTGLISYIKRKIRGKLPTLKQTIVETNPATEIRAVEEVVNTEKTAKILENE